MTDVPVWQGETLLELLVLTLISMYFHYNLANKSFLTRRACCVCDGNLVWISVYQTKAAETVAVGCIFTASMQNMTLSGSWTEHGLCSSRQLPPPHSDSPGVRVCSCCRRPHQVDRTTWRVSVDWGFTDRWVFDFPRCLSEKTSRRWWVIVKIVFSSNGSSVSMFRQH